MDGYDRNSCLQFDSEVT